MERLGHEWFPHGAEASEAEEMSNSNTQGDGDVH